ncbi:MAG TPA: hypothetical protein VLH08_16010, partial [Acidobacteriota bacterium]|nr:hypothetical protein [Acidobacteriota bacterium]
MFDLFRFVMLRPPEKNGTDDTIQINQESDFILQMQQAHDSDSPATKMKELADEFVQGNAFVKDVSSLEHSQQIESFHSELQQLLKHPDADGSLQTLSGLAGSAFGANASDVISNGTLNSEYRRLYESLIAAKYATSSVEVSVVPIQRY